MSETKDLKPTFTGDALSRRALCRALALAPVAAGLGLSTPAFADIAYPTKPVRVIVPFGAGGVADITARIVTERLGDKLGQRFVIENQAGPGGINAARTVLSGGTDGHTLALFSNGTAVSVNIFKDLRFDPLKDFTPISTLGFFDFILATNAKSNYKTLKDFVDYAKANPGKLNVGTVVAGSTQNLSAELFKSAAGIDFRIVPYRNTPDLLLSLTRGDMDLMIDSYASLKGMLDDKQILALAASGPVRSTVTPNIPTVQEAGVAGYDVTSWNALFAPAGTSPEIVAKIQKALVEVLGEAEIKRKLLELGIEAKATTQAELKARLEDDIKKWAAVIEKAGIQKN
jgi:tripartite-type tricarboxylate transporter receptor subunit TctC